jgi:hypothetical protein
MRTCIMTHVLNGILGLRFSITGIQGRWTIRLIWACTGAERQSQFKAVKPIATISTQRWPISDTEEDDVVAAGK